MRTRDADKLARELMGQHGLLDKGWIFKGFDNSRRRFGYCGILRRTNTKYISLSRNLVGLNDEARVRNTILHEIAHAKDWERTGKLGHGRSWKVMAASVGIDPVRCYSEANTVRPKAPYEAECPGCHRKVQRFRLPNHRGSMSCSFCAPRYDERFKLEFRRR